MGKGDKRTKRGKISVGSYGNSRKKVVAVVPTKSATTKKAETKKPAAKAPTKRVVKK